MGSPRYDFQASNTTSITLQHRDGPGAGDYGDHDVEETVVDTASCGKPGKENLRCKTPGCNWSQNDVEIPALQHEWEEQDAKWEGLEGSPVNANSVKCTVTRKCITPGGCGQTDEVECTVENRGLQQSKTKMASCTEPEKSTFTASGNWTLGDKEAFTKTSTEVETAPKNGHTWNDAEFTWTADYQSATAEAKRTCQVCGFKQDPKDNQVTVTETRKDATCVADGTVTYHAEATFVGKGGPDETTEVTATADTEGFTIPRKSHEYEKEVVWSGWTADNTITATRHCTLGPDGTGHDVDGQVKIESVTDGATCTTPGKVTYTATATFEDDTQTYSATPKEVSNTVLGHSYEVSFEWGNKVPEAPNYLYDPTISVTLTCTNDKHNDDVDGPKSVKSTAKVGTNGSYVEGESTKPNCVASGSMVYEATVELPEGENNHWDGGGKDPKTEEIPEPIKYQPLGHQWPDVAPTLIWANETAPDSVTATAKVKCGRPGCDDATGYGSTEGKEVAATIAKDVEAATCTTNGTAKYTATLAITDAQPSTSYTYPVKEVTLTAQGHKLGAVTYNWPSDADELAKGDSGLTDGDVTATAVCSVCGAQLSSTSVKLEKSAEPDKWKAPTYLANGVHTYTASDAEFSDGLSGTLKATTSDTKDYTLTKLDPPTPNPTVPSGIPNEQGVKDALSAAASAAVTQALNSATCPAGMDETLYNAIQEAGAGTEGSMTVSTELTVDDNAKNPVDGQTYPTGAGQTLENYYDIQIKVTVTSASISGGGSQTSNITQIATPIQLSVAKPGSGGPIFYVARYHDDSWQKLPTTVSGNYLLFSSNLFSPYAVISSNSIADAEVDPIPNQTYTGSAITPKVVVYINGDKEHPLVEGVDYELEWSNNVNVGTATVTIKSLGTQGLDAASTKTVTFSIVAAPSGGSGSGGATSPNTGDEAPLALYAGMLTLCLAGLAGIAVRRRKNK